VLKAVVQVLGDRAEPMRARDIHTAVETLLGEPVAWSSVKMALASNVSCSSCRWAALHREELEADWERVYGGTVPEPIAPLP
jgi:hypothetical protein